MPNKPKLYYLLKPFIILFLSALLMSASCHKRSKCATYKDSDFFNKKTFKEKLKEDAKASAKAYQKAPGLSKRNKRKSRSSIWGTR
ncbi:MAG: hypothetical protein EAZ57_00100 [Cytophagales bacterium]|nr:MAG: hypothetical protein EAZ67_04625 [Cytophagales bacterium]TAF62538.1 MAG: hypothetical protein EAZ57_00100 [Cytophagales bacterium]